VFATSTLAGAIVVLRPLAGTIFAASTLTATLTNTGPILAVGWLEAGAFATGPESVGDASTYEGAGASTATESTSGVLALIE
jgi:hypothetical protein